MLAALLLIAGVAGWLVMGSGGPTAIPAAALESIAVDTTREPLASSTARSLAADEGIWRATRWLVTLGAMQLLVGSVGLYALFWTLAETRHAAEATVAGTRAYLFARIEDDFDGPVGRPGLAGGRDRIVVVIENVGQTPARQVCIESIERSGMNGKTSMKLFNKGAIGGGQEIRFTIAQARDSTTLRSQARERRPYYVTVKGTYQPEPGLGGREPMCLTFVYVQHPNTDVDVEYSWQVREGEYDPAQDPFAEAEPDLAVAD